MRWPFSRLNANKHSHGRISTRIRFGNHKEASARAFSQDEVRVADYFEQDLFGRGWRRYCHVRVGVGFTEEPRIEVKLFTTLDAVSICVAETVSVVH
jgi:hypothetical protein